MMLPFPAGARPPAEVKEEPQSPPEESSSSPISDNSPWESCSGGSGQVNGWLEKDNTGCFNPDDGFYAKASKNDVVGRVQVHRLVGELQGPLRRRRAGRRSAAGPRVREGPLRHLQQGYRLLLLLQAPVGFGQRLRGVEGQGLGPPRHVLRARGRQRLLRLVPG